MSYRLRSCHRVPVCCSVTYEHKLRDGRGTVFNLSTHGWRLCGDLLLQPGDLCSLRVTLPTRQRVTMAAGRVRWVQGTDYGIETLLMDTRDEARLAAYIRETITEL